MKKTKLMVSAVLATLLCSSAYVMIHAEDKNPDSNNINGSSFVAEEESSHDPFNTLNENEKVLPLGDGYLYGEAVIYDGTTRTSRSVNSKTDPNSITIKEVQELENQKTNTNFGG